MTDRELLEFAAKAAGIPVPKLERGRPNPWHYIDDKGIHKDISCGGDGTRWNRWNPLEDDSDALRLAVKLRMSVAIGDGGCVIVQAWTDEHELSLVSINELLSQDELAATRRAITRAAAEIGMRSCNPGD